MYATSNLQYLTDLCRIEWVIAVWRWAQKDHASTWPWQHDVQSTIILLYSQMQGGDQIYPCRVGCSTNALPLRTKNWLCTSTPFHGCLSTLNRAQRSYCMRSDERTNINGLSLLWHTFSCYCPGSSCLVLSQSPETNRNWWERSACDRRNCGNDFTVC